MKIQLSKQQLETLIPPGSEIEAELVGGVLSNYSDRIAKMVAARITTAAAEQSATIARKASSEVNESIAPWSHTLYQHKLKPTVEKEITETVKLHLTNQSKLIMEQLLSPETIEKRIDAAVERSILRRIDFFVEKKLAPAVDAAVSKLNIDTAVSEALKRELREKLS